eukprot:1459301-Alexandrium_andersonii.AAC.1
MSESRWRHPTSPLRLRLRLRLTTMAAGLRHPPRIQAPPTPTAGSRPPGSVTASRLGGRCKQEVGGLQVAGSGSSAILASWPKQLDGRGGVAARRCGTIQS